MASIGQLGQYDLPAATILCAVLSSVPLAGHAQDRYPVDWPAVATESMEHFLALLRTDTSNPPGNETEAALYLQEVLQQKGIDAELFALDPTRANLVARLRGNGSKPPILVMAHTDVVGVQRENWSVDPFASVVRDGYVYGRGALDDPNVEIIPEGVYRPASPPSSLQNEMFQALESATARLFPNAVTLPTMLNGATDMAQIRARGTQCYGFGPVRTEDDVNGGGGAHGDDERILESSLLSLVQFLWYAVVEVAASER